MQTEMVCIRPLFSKPKSEQKIFGQRSFSVCSLCGHCSSILIQIQDLTSFISKSYILIHRLLQGISFSGLVLVFNLQ